MKNSRVSKANPKMNQLISRDIKKQLNKIMDLLEENDSCAEFQYPVDVEGE